MPTEKKGFRRTVSCVLLWTGLCLVGIIVVPACILLSLVYALCKVFNAVFEKINND